MKKVIALVLATLMILSFASCGKTPPAEDTTASTPEVTTPEATTPEVTTPEVTTPEATTPEVTTPEATTPEVTTPEEPEKPDPSKLPDAYADFDFTGGTIKDIKGKVSIRNMGALVQKTNVTASGKGVSMDALCIRESGQYVICTFDDLSSVSEMKTWAQDGFTVEAFYVMGQKGVAQGVVCGTEAKGGWGIAEDKTGKPYFITGNGNAYNAGAYAKSASSASELVHVVGVYDFAAKEQRIYINGVLQATTPIGGDYFYGSAGSFNKFCLGGDIKATGEGGDFICSNMTMVDAKIYASALSSEQAERAYQNALSLLQ